MINLYISNFWYCNKIIQLTKSWLLCTLYNLTKYDLNILRIILKDSYNSKLHILKNKYLTNLHLNLDIYNKSMVITSFEKNLYFLRTNLFELVNTLFKNNKNNFNILGLFNNGRLIDSSIFFKYKNDNLLTFFNFFKKNSINILSNVVITNTFTNLFCNHIILNYYIYYNISSLLNRNFFLKTNLF